jgi:hypothetical protein
MLISLFSSLDRMHEEPELKTQVELAEEANPELEPEQGKPGCITLNPWLLFELLYLC